MPILLFAIIDGGRFAWEYNRAEKATQIGARMAVVTDVISTDLPLPKAKARERRNLP